MYTHHPQTHKKPKLKKSPVDRAMDVVAIASPALGVPQAVQIFATQDASGLSLLSWGSFACVSIVFLLYGLQHHIKPLILTQVLWLTIYAAVIPGILIYG